MSLGNRYKVLGFVLLCLAINIAHAQVGTDSSSTSSTAKDTTLQYPFDNPQSQPAGSKSGNPVQLKEPDNVEYKVEYDPATNRYVIKEKIGDKEYRTSRTMSFEEYWAEKNKENQKDYWREKLKENSASSSSSNSESDPFSLSKKFGKEDGKSIFGSNKVEIKPQGSAELFFGVVSRSTKNPILNADNQRVTTPDFDMKIQLNVVGKIGEKLQLKTNYNTEASFDFENQMKLEYTGDEDEILKKVELGNVSLPLNSSLIQGSQSLFGIKTEMQFGKLKVTSILTQQKSESKTIELSGGAQTKRVEITADKYDDNRHFFLSQYFFNNYDTACSTLPLINSPIQVTKLEVWVTNVGISANQNARNLIAFSDLGEFKPYDSGLIPSANKNDSFPSNISNDLYSKVSADPLVRDYYSAAGQLINAYNYTAGVHFNKIENARKLSENEYYFNPQLGYISLNRKMEPDEVLAVAFQYTLPGETKPRQVGEFSTDVPEVNSALFLKMLKSTQVNNTKVPLWNLMMKNVYSLGQYGIDASSLNIDVMYLNPETNNKINYLWEGPNKDKRWIEIMGVDRLDPQLNRQPDGRYDIIDGVTIRLQNGRIYFPVREPFGSHLRKNIGSQSVADKFVFDSLYTVAKYKATNEFPEKNRFVITAQYEAQSSVIQLNAFSIPQGAVSVTAGGKKLVEGVDFRVDYNMGQVTILDQGVLNSNTPIRVNVESNSMFSVMSKTLFGTNLEYQVNRDFTIGGTVMNLTERPLTQKTNQGDEPISNTIWGINTNYKTESEYLTKLVDLIPFIETKEKSSVSLTGEFAHLIPGSPDAIKINGEPQSYVDHFESAQTNIDLRNRAAWSIASTPQGQSDIGTWPEGNLMNDQAYGFNRAKIAWYNIDPLFAATSGNKYTPDHIKNNPAIQGNHYQRIVEQNEVFPNKSLQLGEAPTLLTLDVSYFPNERGPYNFDTTGGTYSSGIDKTTGLLKDPETRWGGIMRDIDYVDFESQNIEFIEFWVMNPFQDDDGDVSALNNSLKGGDLYIHLGNVSEDILRDGKKAFENGLPTEDSDTQTDTSNWGRVSTKINLVNAFDNDPAARVKQDVGFDGFSDSQESSFYKNYIDWFGTNPPSPIASDPAADNYKYFQGDDLDNAKANVIERYKNYNGPDGNSPIQTNSDIITTATTLPDIEDINRDNTLSEGESYYEYKISMRPEDLKEEDIGTNYLTQVYSTNSTVSGGAVKTIKWYQFRIPVRKPNKTIGNITDFQSIRFLRMLLKDWDKSTTLRFATFDLVRSDWRKYLNSLIEPGEVQPSNDDVLFNLGAVNLEEDSKKEPVQYMMPPNIQRVTNIATQSQENEQALQMQVCDLDGGDARAIYKQTNLDLISYKQIKMDVHAEQIGDAVLDLDNMNMSLFLRMGSDFDNNYYEYEVPLKFTDPTSSALSSTDEAARNEIWRSENFIDFNYIEEWVDKLKISRMNDIASGVSNINTTNRYTKSSGSHKVTIKGNPSMSDVRTIMIGVRNNNKTGEKRCAEVWVNELRLSGFEDQGGWATTGNMNVKLADFANISLGGGYSTPGWGAIDQKVSDRSREYIRNIDATGSFAMGKFFPEKYGVNVPLYVSYNQLQKVKKYDPLNGDVNVGNLENDLQKKINDISADVQTSKSINVSNVKISPKKSGKSQIYSISNFDATYAYNENKKRDINTEYNNVKNYKGALNYNFNTRAHNVTPFKRTPLISSYEKIRLKRFSKQEQELKDSLARARRAKAKPARIKELNEQIKELTVERNEFKKSIRKLKTSPYLRLYRDFNFYYYPSSIKIQTDMTRMFSENKIRNVSDADLLIKPTFNKNWYFNRNYNIKFDLTKALKVNYTAKNQAFIDEPYGSLDSQEKKDSVMTNIKNFGRNTFYTQSININYNIPINKFPLTSWITSSAKYTGKYDWKAAPLSLDTLGNDISNSNNRSINAQFNMLNLYNKIPYLKKVNSNSRRRKPSPKKDPNDSTKTKKPPVITAKDVLDGGLRAIMMLRNASFNYSENYGTFIPGFLPKTEVIGMNTATQAPGLGFVVGSQKSIMDQAVQNEWLAKNTYLLGNRVSNTVKKSLNLRATIEPFKDFRVELSGQRSVTESDNYFYLYDNLQQNGWSKYSPQNTGTFNISTNTFATSFSKRDNNRVSNAFKQMENNRKVVADRLATQNPNYTNTIDPNTSFPTGYGKKQSEVLLYSFMAAYTGKNAADQKLNPFPAIPLPNWRINYSGLMKVPAINRNFSSFTVSHQYRSTYNFNNYKNNLNYISGTEIDSSANFITELDFQNIDVSIQEQFSPLIKIDTKLKNSIIAKIEFKKSRTVGLNFSRNTVTEQHTFDFIIGTGYTIRQLKLPFIKIKGKALKSDLDLKGDLSIKSSDLTMLEVDGNPTTTQGARILTIKITADYIVSQKVTARLFYDQTVNTPYINTSFPNSTTRGGISIRFTL